MGFDRGAITNQGSAWAEVCMHQAHTKPWLITSLNVGREWSHFLLVMLCYALNVLVEQESKPRNMIEFTYTEYKEYAACLCY